MTRTVLIVDDCSITRSYIAIALIEAGYQTIEAADGLDGLRKLDGRRVDLIISDLDMPNMGGLAFVKATRSLLNYSDVPVIIHSSASEETKKAYGHQVDVQLWLPKPTLPADFARCVAELLAR